MDRSRGPMARGDDADAAGPSHTEPDPWWFSGRPEWNVHTDRLIRDGFHGDANEFCGSMVALFEDAGLFNSPAFPTLDVQIAHQFFEILFDAFKPVPYHCAFHGQSTAQAAHVLLTQLIANNHGPFSDVEVLAVLLAAVGKNVGHLGMTNGHLLATNHPLTNLYPANTNEMYSAQILTHVLNDPSCGIARCAANQSQSKRLLDLVGRLIQTAAPTEREITVAEFFGLTERIRTRSGSNSYADTPTNENSWDERSDLPIDFNLDFIPPGAGVFSQREKQNVQAMVVLCAELSWMTKGLDTCEFWKDRQRLERAGKTMARTSGSGDETRGNGGSADDTGVDTGDQESNARISSLTSQRFDNLDTIAVPAFHAFSVFAEQTWASAVQLQLKRNSKVYKNRAAQLDIRNRRRLRQNAVTKTLIDAAGAMALVFTYVVSRRGVFREKIAFLRKRRDDKRGSERVIKAATEAIFVFEVARARFVVYLAIVTAILVSCVALATPVARKYLTVQFRERVVFCVSATQVFARFFFSHHRAMLNSTMHGIGVESLFHGESLLRESPFIGGWIGKNVIGLTFHSSTVITTVTSLVYYFGAIQMSPMSHVFWHSVACAVRFAANEVQARSEPLGAWWYPLRVWGYVPLFNPKMWCAIVSFPLVICVVDWKHAQAAIPSVFIRRMVDSIFAVTPLGIHSQRRDTGNGELVTRNREGMFSSVLCRGW